MLAKKKSSKFYQWISKNRLVLIIIIFVFVGTILSVAGLIWAGWNFIKFITNPLTILIAIVLLYVGISMLFSFGKERNIKKNGFYD